MDSGLLRCLSFLLLLGIISGSSADIIKQTRKYGNLEDQEFFSSSEDTNMIMHDTYPTIIGNPTDDSPTVNQSPTTTPTTTPMTAPPTTPFPLPPITPFPIPPTTPFTGSPATPTTGSPTTPTITPTTPSAGGGAGGGTGGGGGAGGGTGGGGGTWCVANPSASEKALQVGLDYACGYGGADCSQIQSGASCYNPNTLRDHASFAYNDYYQKNPAPTSCDFGGTAQLVNIDPSSGSCHFPSKGSASITPATPTPAMQTPPAMLSPPSPPSTLMPGTPFGGGASGFGQEPTASPNMAMKTSQHLLLFLSSTSILVYFLLVDHL